MILTARAEVPDPDRWPPLCGRNRTLCGIVVAVSAWHTWNNGYLSGLTDPGPPRNRRRVLAGVGLFVLGSATVFTLYGAAFGAIGSWLLRWQDPLMRGLGVVVILMGLALLGLAPWLQQDRKLALWRRTGLGGVRLLGIVFGLGWTPCMGPTLSALSLSVTTSSAGRGALLAFAYCLGLGIPFAFRAMGLGWVSSVLALVRRHIRIVNIAEPPCSSSWGSSWSPESGAAGSMKCKTSPEPS